jgi:hypothetical protein
MLIGLTGYAQSGKDTIANILVEKFGFVRVAFADPIRDFCYEVNPMITHVGNEPVFLRTIVDRDGWDKAKQLPGVRRLLQNVGVSARDKFGEYFWITEAMKKVRFDSRIVVTDVRFTNEAEWIKNYEDSHMWRVVRPGVGAVNNHVSESQMANYKVDQVFINDGGIEDLEQMIVTRMRAYV